MIEKIMSYIVNSKHWSTDEFNKHLYTKNKGYDCNCYIHSLLFMLKVFIEISVILGVPQIIILSKTLGQNWRDHK